MKNALIITSLFLSIAGFGQEVLVLGQSEKVQFNADSETEGIDSLIFISVPGRFCVCDSIEVYYDTAKTQLAYKSFDSKKDSCHTFNYWRNGILKKHVIYTPAIDGFPNWWWHEAYCSNGQLIFKGPSPNQPQKKLYTTYDCSGQKIVEFVHQGYGAVGAIRFWYPNGQLKSIQNFEDHKEEGEWIFYDEQGEIERIEVYQNGELISTKEN